MKPSSKYTLKVDCAGDTRLNVAGDIVLSLSVVYFLYLNLKSVHSFAFLGSVAYKKKVSSVRGRRKEQWYSHNLRLRVSARVECLWANMDNSSQN